MVNGTLALDDERPIYILAGTTIRNQEALGQVEMHPVWTVGFRLADAESVLVQSGR